MLLTVRNAERDTGVEPVSTAWGRLGTTEAVYQSRDFLKSTKRIFNHRLSSGKASFVITGTIRKGSVLRLEQSRRVKLTQSRCPIRSDKPFTPSSRGVVMDFFVMVLQSPGYIFGPLMMLAGLIAVAVCVRATLVPIARPPSLLGGRSCRPRAAGVVGAGVGASMWAAFGSSGPRRG